MKIENHITAESYASLRLTARCRILTELDKTPIRFNLRAERAYHLDSTSEEPSYEVRWYTDHASERLEVHGELYGRKEAKELFNLLTCDLGDQAIRRAIDWMRESMNDGTNDHPRMVRTIIDALWDAVNIKSPA